MIRRRRAEKEKQPAERGILPRRYIGEDYRMPDQTGAVRQITWSLVFIVGGLYLSVKYILRAITLPDIGTFVTVFLGLAMFVQGCRGLAITRMRRR